MIENMLKGKTPEEMYPHIQDALYYADSEEAWVIWLLHRAAEDSVEKVVKSFRKTADEMLEKIRLGAIPKKYQIRVKQTKAKMERARKQMDHPEFTRFVAAKLGAM